MNWINGLHSASAALVCVSAFGMILALLRLADPSLGRELANWKRARPTIAVLTVALLLGAFMAGAAA